MSRRQQLLATAAELFAARGFHGVSVGDIGAACGISGPALYRHFPSKDAMLAEMLVSISEELLEVGRIRVAEARDPARGGYGGRGVPMHARSRSKDPAPTPPPGEPCPVKHCW